MMSLKFQGRELRDPDTDMICMALASSSMLVKDVMLERGDMGTYNNSNLAEL